MSKISWFVVALSLQSLLVPAGAVSTPVGQGSFPQAFAETPSHATIPLTPTVEGSTVRIPIPAAAAHVSVQAAWLESQVPHVALESREFRIEDTGLGRVYVVDDVPQGETLVFRPFELGSVPLFSYGDPATVELKERPMFMRIIGMEKAASPQDHYAHVAIDFTAADHSGQTVAWNKAWLSDLGVVLPWFLWDGLHTLEPTQDATHYFTRPEHFTSIDATSIDVEYDDATTATIYWTVSSWSAQCLASQHASWVDYGTTTSYGSTSTAAGDPHYSTTVFSLADDTLYHFKITAYCEDTFGTPYQTTSGDKVMIGVGVKLCADDDYAALYPNNAWQSRINDNMEWAANNFFSTFGIDFYRTEYCTYTNSYSARAQATAETYRDQAQTGLSWPGTDGGADLLVLYTNLDLGESNGGVWDGSVYGVSEQPSLESKGTNADAMVIEPGPNSDSNDWRRWLLQHESSHPFDASDYGAEISGCSVMDYTDYPGSPDCGTSGATGWDSTSSTSITNNRASVADRDDVHTAV